MTAYLITERSSNRKTGPLLVISSRSKTCADACPLKSTVCYAAFHYTGKMWAGLDATNPGHTFKHGTGNILVHGIDAVCAAVRRQVRRLWRFNIFGDLPGDGDTIDAGELKRIVDANAEANAKGFTYSHKPVIDHPEAERNLDLIETAIARGFTVNVSANSLADCDRYAGLDVPVCTVLPEAYKAQRETVTPKGQRVLICPAVRDDTVQCASCGLCAVATRGFIIGFPAHGSGKKQAERL